MHRQPCDTVFSRFSSDICYSAVRASSDLFHSLQDSGETALGTAAALLPIRNRISSSLDEPRLRSLHDTLTTHANSPISVCLLLLLMIYRLSHFDCRICSKSPRRYQALIYPRYLICKKIICAKSWDSLSS
jgi:hypothetical protein